MQPKLTPREKVLVILMAQALVFWVVSLGLSYLLWTHEPDRRFGNTLETLMVPMLQWVFTIPPIANALGFAWSVHRLLALRRSNLRWA